jgi:hypothetical protein
VSIPPEGSVPSAHSPLSEPVDVYQLDPVTEAAADGWPLVSDTPEHDGPTIDPETGRNALAIRCGECRQMVGFQAGYTFCLTTLRPRVLEHLVRSHDYPANPTRVDT